MNGAQSLVHTLVDSGVDVCFANPGTSEMHFVAALEDIDAMRGVLGLFEGVVTGAADGYARIADRPAATLLHLGPGLGNGWANLHNARRAHTPLVNIVGDHATHHKQYDAPLDSDIEALAGSLGTWVRRSRCTSEIGRDAAAAVAAAREGAGQIATLILPADASWGEGGERGVLVAPPSKSVVNPATVDHVASVLTSGEPAALLIGGGACREAGLLATSRLAVATGVKTFVETFPTRLERGEGVPMVERLGYLPEQATVQLGNIKHLVVAGAKPPVAFFAYPGVASNLVPEGTQVHMLADTAQDVVRALADVADLVAGDVEPLLQRAVRRPLPSGLLTPQNWIDVISALLPARAIIVDESNTSGLLLPAATAGAPRHDVLTLTGGAIGYGLPVATGAAVAAPDRPVIGLQADGSAMYTISALWTQARENLNVTTVLLNNHAYAILRLELQRVGAGADGPQADNLLDLSGPDLDFVKIAEGMGVPATRATTAEELAAQFSAALSESGPHLIEAIVPSLF
ncbi:acetolactate synthase large subunit [Mycolicibacterium iranicum]|uniref:acetolactate synthase n=1 Tax=Mycolicibacterium iranicum TaxID=912594 RepID=A0A1X1WWW3_MYCIR|nr:acetolactate synthase large subunit [Mycolicibacterium iranicum]ORV91102.1 decarboxylase [Mycolicibacterium iranicum]